MKTVIRIDNGNPLGAARGGMIGSMIGIIFWATIAAAAYLVQA